MPAIPEPGGPAGAPAPTGGSAPAPSAKAGAGGIPAGGMPVAQSPFADVFGMISSSANAKSAVQPPPFNPYANMGAAAQFIPPAVLGLFQGSGMPGGPAPWFGEAYLGQGDDLAKARNQPGAIIGMDAAAYNQDKWAKDRK